MNNQRTIADVAREMEIEEESARLEARARALVARAAALLDGQARRQSGQHRLDLPPEMMALRKPSA